MAKKPTTTKNFDSDVARELEEALDFDLSAGADDLDIAASMEDLEAQISQAADELAREGRAESNAQAAASSVASTSAPAPASAASTSAPAPANEDVPASTWFRPANDQPNGFAPANDDRQKDYRSLLQGMNRRSSNAIYWVVAVLSLLWIAGGVLFGRMLTPNLLDIRSVEQLVATPNAILLAVATIVPVILFRTIPDRSRLPPG
jgi:hypothetical protein